MRPGQDAWEFFLQEFDKDYIGERYKNRMRAEFVSLKQGKRTVDEYYEEFKRLSQYAPALVATEQEKCLKFLNGLNKKTFAIVNTSPVKRFSKLLDRARRAEESLNRPSDTESEEEEKRNKKRPATQLQIASKSSKWSKQSTPSQSRGGKSKIGLSRLLFL